MNRLLVTIAGIGLATAASAQGAPANTSPLQATLTGSGVEVSLPTTVTQSHSRAPVYVTIDLSQPGPINEASWDTLDDPSNTTLLIPIPVGKTLQGVGWDLSIQTVAAGSQADDSVFYFDGSDLDGSGLFLTPGVGVAASGTFSFDSSNYPNGIIDLTSVGIPDITIQTDGLLHIQLFENPDNLADQIDNLYVAHPFLGTESTITIVYDDVVIPPTECPIWEEDFDSGTWPPAGWQVIDNGTPAGQTWMTSSAFPRGNDVFPFDGESASVDADFYGSGGTRDTELWTFPFVVNAAAASKLRYNQSFNALSSGSGLDNADVDISTDNGVTWTTLKSYIGDIYTPDFIDLTPYTGLTVIVRFRYWDGGNWGWWWQIDDVKYMDAATATQRNAGTNYDCYTVSGPPILGESFDMVVDVALANTLTTTGLTFNAALVGGYAGPLNINLGGEAKTVLVDISGPDQLAYVLQTGATTVTYSQPVPSLCVLVGYAVYTQAAVIALQPPPVPWKLTNAQDLVLGY